MALRRELMSYVGTGAIGGIVGYYAGVKGLLGLQSEKVVRPATEDNSRGDDSTTTEEEKGGDTNVDEDESGERNTVVVDDFENASELSWEIGDERRDRLEFSTKSAEGDYSLYFVQDSEDQSTKISRSLESPQTFTRFSIWFQYESSRNNNFRIQLHDSDENKVTEFREFNGYINYRDPNKRGDYVPHSNIARVNQNTWYQLIVSNINFTTNTFDARINDINGTTVNKVNEVGFWNESNEVSQIKIINGLGRGGNPDPLWIDYITYTP